MIFGSVPVFSMDFVSVKRQLPALGLSDGQLAQPGSVPEVLSGEELVARLRAEALADPAAFIDEHSPQEVGAAFGLQPSRFKITDPKRIEAAAVKLTVDLTRQRLVVVSSGTNKEFKISSGLPPEHATPGSGSCYAPDFIEEMHYSSLYNKAPMPNSIFFNGNIAMHGTNAEAMLGRPASHGCIRLSKADAKTVYALVRANGKSKAVICVQGVTPAPKP